MRSKEVKIRPATMRDFDLIESVLRSAFTTSDFGYNDEGERMKHLHEQGDALVSLFAEVDGVPVGYIMFSRMEAEADGNPVIAAALAPVGVVPEWQGHGVGGQLIKAGLASLKPQGVQLSFVVGSSDFYARFGYSADIAQPYDSPYAGPYFMAIQLDPTLIPPISGKAEFAPAFSGS